MVEYQNGGFHVQLFSDGTKVRTGEGLPDFPESIDVKITNQCDMACPYCHESSVPEGKHADLDVLLEVLEGLPAGVELAIGGGNPLAHPHLVNFLEDLKVRGLIANITINQGHLGPYRALINRLIDSELVKGIGLSVWHKNYKEVEAIAKLSPNVVAHVIAGVNTPDVIDELLAVGVSKVLVLGYKQFGFGVHYFSPDVELKKDAWKSHLRSLFSKCTLSFDNLAIEQLNVREHFTEEGWNEFYMGDDFTFTMYIDAVTQNYAPTSRSNDRTRFSQKTLFEYFKK